MGWMEDILGITPTQRSEAAATEIRLQCLALAISLGVRDPVEDAKKYHAWVVEGK